MFYPLEIKPLIGLSDMLFDSSMAEVEKKIGKATEVQLIDDIIEFKTTVWHYWEEEFALFFPEQNNQMFNSVEINNITTLLWGHRIFDFKNKKIIALFKSKGFMNFETEQHDWGENSLSFDVACIDFYFVKDKLMTINYSKPILFSQVLITQN